MEQLVDVRRFAGSRRHPQYGAEQLAASLAEQGIGYEHVAALGGRRPVQPGSCNDGWQVAAFRGYADHLRSDEFARGLARLEELAVGRCVVVMCAEAQWWRCHRRLVSDALLVRGWRVRHIGSDGRVEDHSLTPFAVVDDGRLSYPAEQTSLGL